MRTPLSKILRATGADSAEVLQNTLNAMRRKVIAASVATRTTGVVTVDVRTKSPYVSLAIARVRHRRQGALAFGSRQRVRGR